MTVEDGLNPSETLGVFNGEIEEVSIQQIIHFYL